MEPNQNKKVVGSLAGTGTLGKSALKGTESTGAAGGFLARATAITAASTLAKTAGASQAEPAKTSKPIEEVKDGESSGYSDFDEVEIADEMGDNEPNINAVRAQIAADRQKKEAIRQYEAEKAKAGNTTMISAVDSMAEADAANTSENNISVNSEHLNNLWQRIRNFLNGKDDEGNDVEHGTPGRVRFTEICELKGSMSKNSAPGILPYETIIKAFVSSRLSPMLTDAEFKVVFKAIEAYHNESLNLINWRAILSAPVSRETQSFMGMFPRIKKREPGIVDKEAEKRKAEEEKNREEKAKAEEARQKDKKEKELAALRKIDAAPKKKVNTATAQKKGAKSAADEVKKKEKEEKTQQEEEAKAQRKRAELERVQISKEVAEFNQRLMRVKNAFMKAGSSIVNTLRLADTNGDGRISLQEFMTTLQRSNVTVKPDEILYIYEFIDSNKDGKLDYKELSEVLRGTKSIDAAAHIAAIRKEKGLDHGYTPSELANIQDGSKQVSFDKNEIRSVGESVSGMSAILKRSDGEDRKPPPLTDPDESQRNLEVIKAELLEKAFSFEDIIATMGVARPGSLSQVSFEDFTRVVLHFCGTSRFSGYQIKFVFKEVCSNLASANQATLEGAYILMKDFKDKFYPGRPWKSEIDNQAEERRRGAIVSKDDSSDVASVSVAISTIMQGRTNADLAAEQNLAERKQLMADQIAKNKFLAENGGAMLDDFEKHSEASQPLDEIIAIRANDPRQMKPGQETKLVNNAFSNQIFFRQHEVSKRAIAFLGRAQHYDSSMQHMLEHFCEKILQEIEEAAQTQRKRLTPESFVDRYGLSNIGYINYEEFKNIYKSHVHFADEDNFMKPMPDENKLRGLFNTLDPDQRQKISRQDFGKIIIAKGPQSTFLSRLRKKLLKGKERLHNVLLEECQDADRSFGVQGVLPISVFQTIMVDYDLPMVDSDKQELIKEHFLIYDKENNELINYLELFKDVGPRKQVINYKELANHVIKIQALVRGMLARRMTRALRQGGVSSLKVAIKDMATDKTVTPKKEAEKSQEKKAKMTKEDRAKEMTKKKEKAAKEQRMGKRLGQTVEKRLEQVVRPPRETKEKERMRQNKEALEKFIKDQIIASLIEKAYCYGESLEVCKDIQKKFETRPVTKFIYPLLQQFQFSCAGAQPKSLQTMNELGQLMFLNRQNQLSQYDISTTKILQSVNLGTRPPLKHYDIIDLVCDQRSGRIYTLNSNWILEIWNIEQNASFPQKRISVCTNEGGKDFINLYYRSTYNNSKPKFLSLQESNQQILVVNTSCVDGSVVFIDPISFSMLKKIVFRYADFETPTLIKKSIRMLRSVFDSIKKRLGKDPEFIFRETVDLATGEISIKTFVEKLYSIDQSQKKEDLYKTCHHLDNDGNGSISLDEFIGFFGEDVGDHDELNDLDSTLHDEIWPLWVVKEKKLSEMESILSALFKQCSSKYNMTAEEVFGMFDYKDSGLCTTEDFKRILKIMFTEVITQEIEIELLLRLAPTVGSESKINYRELCKFLDKRFVRSFKYVQDLTGLIDKTMDLDGQDVQSNRNKSAVDLELERPLVKEASLNYILRKAAELQIDLRKQFVTADPLELSVLPRVTMWSILINLPLGMNETELAEVIENDLNFDNYGNVDYTGILSSDIFVTLEAKRLRERALQLGNKLKKNASFTDDTVDMINNMMQEDKAANYEQQNENPKVTDNRKVVVEDLVYIDDLQILIYTTIAPKTSQIFITSLSKVQAKKSSDEQNTQTAAVQIVTLQDLTEAAKEKKAEMAAKMQQQDSMKDQNLLTNYYQLIAKLKGHQNNDPPAICYVPQSNCLISGEKSYVKDNFVGGQEAKMNFDDPQQAPTHIHQKSQMGSYEKYSQAKKSGGSGKFEIIVWNLQRDMIELYTRRPPWNVPYFKKFDAHEDSIVEICYLQKAQLLVSSSKDQTIRFWDPVASSFRLTDPGNNPHAQMKPGYYKPMDAEMTKKNETFKEVKRIYTGNETICYALRTLHITNIILNPQVPEMKSQIEWLLCLKLGKPPVSVNHDAAKSSQMGFVCGYGIERIKIEVPALHHDDIEPPHIIKECEELVSQRRQKLVTSFQSILPVRIEKIYSTVQLQNSYIDKVRQLFMSAILNRKDGIFVNPEPLREVYKIILKLPNRTKFESFLASTGCADKLSVSETFFYLQKFMQIHPLRTTQIEFEKSIQDFYERHQRQFLRGVKKWPKQSIQKFANYIREHGLNIQYLMEPSDTVTSEAQARVLLKFCTRERIVNFFMTMVNGKTTFDFSDTDLDVIMNELDPFHTGIIQINLIQRFYAEEIKFHQQVNLNRPQEVLQQIRAIAFPAKRIPLQQALAAADASGDGYLDCNQFIDAFYRAGVKMTRDSLEFLFDVMSERFQSPSTVDDPNALSDQSKYLNLIFFMGKLFSRHENREVYEVDLTLQLVKAALIYKGVDLGNIFAEDNSENDKKPVGKKGAVKGTAKVRKEVKNEEKKVDMMSHYSRFAQCIVKEEFCKRLEQINATNVTSDMIRRLANYLSLNQKNKSVIYLNTWLHHLKRVSTAFNIPMKEALPAICSKLLQNETVFRSLVDTVGLLKQKRDEEKFIDQADLRTVLKKFGVNFINQSLFINEFTKGVKVHIEDLVTVMKACVQKFYGQPVDSLNQNQLETTGQRTSIAGVQDLEAVQNIDFFTQVGTKLRKLAKKQLDLESLTRSFEEFDEAETGSIKSYHLVNVLHRQLPNLFTESEMIGLQYELESLSYDGTVDYHEFIRLFIGKKQKESKKSKDKEEKLKLDVKKSAYSMQDYEDVLGRISVHSKSQGLDLEHIFGIFAKKSGFINYSEFKKILELISFEISDKDFNLITMYADENRQGTIFVHDFVQQIIYAEVIAPQFEVYKWIIASRELQGRTHLIDSCQDQISQISHEIDIRFGGEDQKHHSKVITGEQFQEIIRIIIPEMSEHDIDMLTLFGVKGSRRKAQPGELNERGVNLGSDLIQFKYFEQALPQVLQHMTKEEVERKQKNQEQLLSQGEVARMRQQLQAQEQEEEKKKQAQLINMDPARQQREQQLINLITNLFKSRDVSFYDAFKTVYDSMAAKNFISISDFKKYVNTLNLPLNVQDQRILRRIADPEGLGRVDLHQFCKRFETIDIKQSRLNKVLDQIATAFFINNFDLKKAFTMFDRSGDGFISRQEFRLGLNSLNIGLAYDQIDDLMKQMSNQADGSISYDDFIMKLDANIRHRRGLLEENVNEALFLKLASCFEYSGESLYDSLKRSDFEDVGTILKEDLIRVLKRIGMSNIDPHLHILLSLAGASETDERIDIHNFSDKVTAEVNKILKSKKVMKDKFLRKIHSLIQTKGLSLFDFFMRMDTNKTHGINKTEMKTGMQALGVNITREEYDAFWKDIYQPKKRLQADKSKRTETINNKLKNDQEEISFHDLINSFVSSGCIHLEKSTDKHDTLLTKYRQQLKKLNMTPEKAYKCYDERDLRFVFKNDFIDVSMAMGLDFSDEELRRIFEIICKHGTQGTASKDQQDQVNTKVKQTTGTRFDLGQFTGTVSQSKDEGWLYQAFIKIHSVVIQKSLTYKRLFTQWRDKNSKTGSGRLNKQELASGLKRLKAGLTQDEISRLAEVQPYEGRDNAISYQEFQDRVVQGAATLEQEQSYERMILVDWIMQFNAQMDRNSYPFEKIFSEFDSEQQGGLTFQDFVNMNEFVGVSLAKKNLKRVFSIIDKDGSGMIVIEEVKALSKLMLRADDNDSDLLPISDDVMEQASEDLKGKDIMIRQQVNDVYEEIKSKLEQKNSTLEHVFFSQVHTEGKEVLENVLPMQNLTKNGVQNGLAKLQIILSSTIAERIVKDVRIANQNKFEVTYKDFIDFLTRRRINVAFLEKGFIDPILASTCTQIQTIKEQYEITYEDIFDIFCSDKESRPLSINKQDFVEAVQSMEIKAAVQDITELFNYIDAEATNRITKNQFVHALSFITSKMGAGSMEQHMNKGIIQVKKNVSNIQLVFTIMRKIADGVQSQKLSIRQLSAAIDINGTGYLTRTEFAHVCHNLVQDLPLDHIRLLTQFFDDKSTGRISTMEFLRVTHEILNQQIGGGVFAFLQVQPIIQKIINQLSIDCDRFFDQVADLNQEFLEKQEQLARKLRNEKRKKAHKQLIKGVDIDEPVQNDDEGQVMKNGLSKSIFFTQLLKNGVLLNEHEKALITTVFGKRNQEKGELDYAQLDSAFEGVQHQLYAQDAQYTSAWERRIFKRIGNYLMQSNKSISECFDLIDTDQSQTISFEELKLALNRFQLNLSDKHLKVFVNRLGDQKKSYITKLEFLTRFWAAYTYEEIEDEPKLGNGKDQTKSQDDYGVPAITMSVSHNIVQANKKIQSELEMKIKQCKMFRSIQKEIRSKLPVQIAFTHMDNMNHGFLTLHDFHQSFAHLFCAISNDNIRALFNEIDTDQNGIIKYEEFENFYNRNYVQKLGVIEKERQMKNTQNEIFDHLIKVLLQRGLTLQDCFDQIDEDKNGYIEVDEFHDMLERMGFTISQQQVYQIILGMDENFDGKLSYHELKQHINKLGFDIDSLEDRLDKGPSRHKDDDAVEHCWRDKALELVIRSIRAKVGKNNSIFEYFKKYDDDHDFHLTPQQFRKAFQDLNEPQLKNNQIERILHIILEKKKTTPLVDITRLNNMLTTYNYVSASGSGSVLIDEDLFVYIVERFDGLSRMRELSDGINDRSGYLSRHIYELNMRGLHMLSNQQTVKRLCRKTHELNRLYESTSILLAGEVTRLIKEEGQMCVLDPTFNVDTIVNDEIFGVLKSISLPTIEQAQFDIDYSTMVTLPCGAAQYEGFMLDTKQPVEITVYPNEVLQYTSMDGKSMKTHLGLELQMIRYLMGARFEEEDEFTTKEEEAMDVFMNFGKFEKRIGLSMHDEKEIYVVNKQIDEDEWINLDDFVSRNGGILNIPLFYHTDAPLFIIRHWAKIILKIIDKVHDVAIVLRCLNLKQLWISRDGQRIRLGHCRGAGLINNMGFIQQCPDIYIHLENNEGNASEGKSSQFAPSKGGGGAFSSSRKTDSGRVFSNQCLDDPFVSPEMLFNKFQDHTAALDVWAFGMILFSVLFGRKPVSYYKVYRDWYRKSHGHDVEMSNLPFIPPSSKNFIYDPFSLDFDNPFDKADYEEFMQSKVHGPKDFSNSLAEESEETEDGSFNFENFMKSIQSLSYSAMFSDGNSKKFTFKPITKQIEDNNNPNKLSVQVPSFPGQQVKNSTYREKTYLHLAKAIVLERKNELGLILDIISSCLDVDPKKRPTIQGMLNSPIFMLDKHELTNAVRFSKNVIIYRSPQSTVCIKITEPLRMICSDAIENPMSLFEREELILKLFAYTEDCIKHIMTLPIEEINDVLTEKEKRKGLMASTLERAAKQRDTQTLRVSPNSPVAAQVIEDKVIDMLLFITFRYMKHFKAYKAKRLAEIEMYAATLAAIEDANKKEGTRSVSGVSKSVRFGETSVLNSEGAQTHMTVNKRELLMRQTERLQNHVLVRMSHLLKLMVYEMHSYCTPLSPYVGEVIRYIVKFFIGEENTFGSEIVLKKTSGVDQCLEEYLKERTFFRRDAELNEKFVSDKCDKAWHMEQKNKSFLDKSNYWTNELHVEALKIFKDAITESGMGQSCYPVINDYIQNVTNSFEPNKIFSKQMNLLSLSFLIPMKYTVAYYNELIPLTESLSRLFNPDLENAGKKCSLAMIRSVFQTGNSDKIKACLDLRLPKHVIHFLQDSMSEIRRECLLIFLEISKGLQDEDFAIRTKHAVNIPQEYSKQGYHKTASDQHKAISMASQQEVLDNKRRGTQSKQKPQHEDGQTAIDQMCNYMKRTIALIEKNENEKYINFALDIPNLNFQASKRFLREMAVCFESPVFIAPLIRLLKTPHETFENKNTILEILKNLVCGNERVLISLNSPACDTYMTLLKMLMQNTKTTNARAQPGGLSAQMRSFLGLQDKTIDLFKYMFEQRRPSIIKDISCIGASSTLLREAGLQIPSFINLADIIGFSDDFEASYSVITPDKIHIDDWVSLIMDLRCWIKHFYSTSNVPELSRIKALQRCMNLLIKILKVVWKHYFSDQIQDQEDNDYAAFEKPDIEKKHKYMELIRATVMLFDWLCLNNKFIFLFNEECGRANLKFVIDTCNKILGQFRRPFGNANKMGPLEDITFNDKMNKQVQNKRRFESFEMTEIGAILQNILYQLVKKNDTFLNQLLSEANFGFIFGEQLILEFDFIRHCIDNQIESMVLMDSYVKKNEIRLNTFEFLLRSHEHTLKDQFVKSNICDRIFSDYIQDFREFNIQFSKIDIEFLAFRRSYPLRLESISLLNTALMLKKNSPQIYTEMLMYSRRHFLIRNEMNLLQTGSMTNKEATSLLLFAIILESNEEDLIYVMVQEGVTRIIKNHLKEYPSLNKRFPVLHQFISGATKSRF